jgi:glucokinase
MPLRKALEKEFPCPVILCNDVDAGTFAEWRFGAAQGARCVVGVFPGTGIGGSCVYEGKLLRGRVSSCMEIGHLHMRTQGQLCGCGQRGCLETVASRLAISARAAEAAYRGNAPYLLEHSGTTLTSIRSRVLAKAIAAGDEAVEDIVLHAARQLGLAIVSVVNLLAPDVVVLGGGLIEALPKPFLAEARQAVQHQAMKPFRKTQVVIAKLGDDAAVLGAALVAAQALRSKQ